MSDILGICSFVPQSEKDTLNNQVLSRFLGFVMPYVTEMFAFAPSSISVKPGECWVNRTQGGMLHFSESNEASFIADSNDKASKIVRLAKSGNEIAGELANFHSELTFDKTKKLATKMTFDYWSLIPDSMDDTRLDRMEARTLGSIKLTLVK